MYKLHIRDDAGKTKVVTVKRDKITVGRQEGNTIRLTDRNVSRIHARIVRKDNKIFLEDVSRYGTRVNGVRLKERKSLSAEDVVAIGDYELKVESKEQQADTVPATPKASIKSKKESKRQEAPTTVEKSVGNVDSTSMINLNDIEQAAREQASKKTRIVADVATLVAVNTELAGTEYRLSGSEIVIGRTDENDVIVDHRSISRNHARIVSKGGRITIFDLDSANGLKINDEFYKQSVLRRGDVIELGHVRMRFVETGETFVYRPEDWGDKPSSSDFSASPTASAQGGSKLWIVALLFLVAAGGVFAVLWSGSDSDELSSSKSASDSKKETSSSASVATPQKKNTEDGNDSKKGVGPGGDESGETLASKLGKIDGLLSDKKWAEAQSLCEAILEDDESNAEALKCVEKANVEATTEEAYTEAKSFADNKQWTKAWKRLASVKDFESESSRKSDIVRLRKKIEPRYQEEQEARSKRDKERKAKKEEASANADRSTKPPAKEAKEAKEKSKPKETAKKEPNKEKPKADPPASDDGGKLTWKDYRKMAARAGGNRLAVYKEAASKGHASAYFYIGRTCQAQGKKAEAIKAYKKFIRLRPSSAQADQAKQALMSLGARF